MSKKSVLIWTKIFPQISLVRLREMRAELGIPLTGFLLLGDCLKWMKSSQKEYDASRNQGAKSTKNDESKLVKLVRFQREISLNHTEIQYGFEQAIFDFILSNKISEEIVGSSDSTGCKFVLSNGENKLARGVYIRIGQNTNLDDIERFIKGKSRKLKELQLEVYRSKPIKYKPSQAHENFYRDLLITEYAKYTLKEIKHMLSTESYSDIDIGGKPTKEILIQRVLRHAGFVVSLDNVKQIIRRKGFKRDT